MRIFASAVIVVTATAMPALAGLIGYTSRPAWTVDVGAPSWTQDFESFVADTSFLSGPVVAGHLTLQQIGTGNFRNKIDVLPLDFSVEGATTNVASMFTNFGITNVSMTFDSPIRAWGADFFSVDAEGVTLLLILSGGGTLSIDVPQGSPGTSAFFGWRTTAGETVTLLSFRSRTDDGSQSAGEGFPLDNIAAVTAVPEPGSGLISGAVLLLSGLYFTARRRPQ